jgi:hypothetical protein
VDSNYAIQRPPEGEALSLSSSPPFNLKVKAVGDSDRIIVGLIDTKVVPDGSAKDAFLLKSLSVVGDTTPPVDKLTHGPAMFDEIMRGVSMMSDSADGSAVQILNVDVYGNSETTTTWDVALGIAKAVNEGAKIINLSLASDGDTALLRQVTQSAHDQGVLIFAAAGNTHVTTSTIPASYPWVVAVTAGDKNGNVTSWANYGDFVAVIAPGSALVSFHGQNYIVTGTSTSTALTTGMAAGYADKSKKPLTAVEAFIRAAFALKASAKP